MQVLDDLPSLNTTAVRKAHRGALLQLQALPLDPLESLQASYAIRTNELIAMTMKVEMGARFDLVSRSFRHLGAAPPELLAQELMNGLMYAALCLQHGRTGDAIRVADFLIGRYEANELIGQDRKLLRIARLRRFAEEPSQENLDVIGEAVEPRSTET